MIHFITFNLLHFKYDHTHRPLVQLFSKIVSPFVIQMNYLFFLSILNKMKNNIYFVNFVK